MAKNKLLIIGKFHDPVKGGIENITSFQEKIYRNFEDIHFIFFSKKKIISKKIFFFKYISLFRQPISISLFFWIFRNINKYEFIEIHCPNPLVMMYILFLNFKNNVKIVIHYHSDIVNQKILNFLLSTIVKISLNRCYKIISTSKKYVVHSKLLLKHLEKVLIIPPVIDEDRFKDTSYLPNLIANDIKLLSIGRFVKYKGFENLIKSISHLPNNYKLTLIGNGPLKKKYIDLINLYKLHERVIILNNIDDYSLGENIKNCNIFVLPSINKSEAFGVVLLEALFFGRPLLTSNLFDSGVTEVNKESITGYHFDQSSPKDISKKIMLLVKLIKKGNFNYKKIRKYYDLNYSKEITKSKHFSLYNIYI